MNAPDLLCGCVLPDVNSSACCRRLMVKAVGLTSDFLCRFLANSFKRAVWSRSDDIRFRLAGSASPSKAELKAQLHIATAALREIQQVAQAACKALDQRSDGGPEINRPSAAPMLGHAASLAPSVKRSKRKHPQPMGGFHSLHVCCPCQAPTCM